MWGLCTVRAGDLAPDHADLGAANLLLSLVDERDLLAEVEAVDRSSESGPYYQHKLGNLLGSVGAVDTLDLDQARGRVGNVTGTLVGKVATPVV